MQLLLIPPEQLQACWPHIAHLADQIADGRGHGRRRPEDIYNSVLHGAELCWGVVDEAGQAKALVLGAILEFPLMKVLRVHSCVGSDRAKWLHLLNQLEDFARANGCSDLEIICRKGWARELSDYKLTHVVMVRAL